ncbi:aldehyde dehydrogenase family protein [Myceligenerans pegani]|uniref:Aldehyde dehydrogenase family protein n=1 Tax=Myceligenerans pegani TaxID=2776917 RepID=A0ABR9N5S7_9MICO|nr:aldehyde dehydrogenase family protein [Myceligenerans sp. TRM 65318]MBE1878998.1 aldehyde dehydrogenase family protein [Myceligenerans sp. TRM 65318]MBE3021269.1 aldehyde dehydrogenase family protein [Myceligenerans sp. TRM 65318]
MTFFRQDEWDGRAYVGGWTELEGTATVVSPSTGATLATVASGSAADLADAVGRAAAAQRDWAARPAHERADVMRRAAAVIEAHGEVLARWLVDEAGSGRGKAAFEAGLVAADAHQAAASAMMPYGQLLQSAHPRLSLARRRPVGVVGVIAPFNFPTILAARSVFPALALGNAVVLKPDPRTTVAGGLFLAAVVEEAGLPAGVFAVVPGEADVGAALVEHPEVPVISFTGSTEAGRAIGERAGRLLKRAHLELGGNNAMVVLPGVDVAAAASAGAWGSFLHQGQICMTTGRHLVHAGVYDEYVALLAEKARALPAGDPATGTPLGPVIDAKQLARIDEIVTDTVAAGARLAAGGTYTDLFYQPTVLADVQPDHRAFTDEIFGPVAPVVRFEDVDEAIDLVNATGYGLSAALLGPDAFKAFELGDRIPSGILHINDQTVDDEAQAPFGGTGFSGTGARFGGHEANIEAFTETQWVTVQSHIQRYPF